MNNIEIIGILIGIVIIIIVGYIIFNEITKFRRRKEINKEKEKALKIKKQKRKQKILTYDPNNSRYVVCRECGYENPKNLSKCWDCGADLTKQKPIYSKKHIKTEQKTVIKSETANKPKNVNYKKTKSCKYERCPKCNSLVNMEINSICGYCNYDILSENIKYCRFCATKMPVNATICRNCKRPLEEN